MPRVLILLVVTALFACKSHDQAPAAVITQASGVVERGPNGGAFVPAALGTKLNLGDLVHTGVGTATLSLADGGKLSLEPNTTVLLRARAGKAQIEVGAGAVLLDGKGTYAVEMGQVRLVDGTVRITGTHGKPTYELVLGHGVLIDDSGQQQALELGKVMLIEMGKATLVTSDAGVADAPVDATPVAVITPDGVSMEITGDGAMLTLEGGKPTKLAGGITRVPARARVTLDGQTHATMTSPGASFTLDGGTQLKIGEHLDVTIDRGSAVTTVAAGGTVDISVPGGVIAPATTATEPAETKIDVDTHGDARVAALAGGAKLTGRRAGASPITLAVGTGGIVRASGRAELGDVVIPTYFDHALEAGTLPMVMIHDPAGATALRFTYERKCPAAGVIEVDTDLRFRTPRITAGKDAANVLLTAGIWSYRLRCGGALPIAAGRIVVRRDSGTRPLPEAPANYPIDADGRTYRISYQSLIPDVTIQAKEAGELHLVLNGAEQVFKSNTLTFAVPGTSLKESTYTFYVVHDGQKSKVSTLIVDFDQTAAQVYIETPTEGRPWPDPVKIRGAVTPGWTVAVGGVDVPYDKVTRRFETTIPPPKDARAIAIQLSHPQRGVHLYLRRGAPAR